MNSNNTNCSDIIAAFASVSELLTKLMWVHPFALNLRNEYPIASDSCMYDNVK